MGKVAAGGKPPYVEPGVVGGVGLLRGEDGVIARLRVHAQGGAGRLEPFERGCWRALVRRTAP